MRRRNADRGAVPRLSAGAHVAARRACGGGARCAGDRAALQIDWRRGRRERLRERRAAGGERRERHPVRAPAQRVRDGGGARDDARRGARADPPGAVTLRRGTVVAVDEAGAVARIRVSCNDEERPAISYGPVEVGDDVVVNTSALDLGLGSGGFDIVHVNLTRGLDVPGREDAHVMKLNYTSLQHPVDPVEIDVDHQMGGKRRSRGPVAVIALHGQLPCVAWQAHQRLPDARIGYIQTWGGALPGPLSRVVQELKERQLIAGHITAGAAHGGEHEAISTEGAIQAAFELGWEAAIIGPGPGIVGSDS